MYGFVSGFFRKKSLLLALLFGAASLSPRCARAEAVSFSGKVVDAAGAGIPWALIQLEDGDLIGQSGLDGSFSLSGNVAAMVFYPDLEPGLPFAARSPAPGLPDRYLPTGRLVSGPYLAAAPLFTDPRGHGKFHSSANTPSKPLSTGDIAAIAPDLPPAPPTLHKTAAAHTLTVRMANYQAGTFPQSAAGAKGLVLTLAKSTTDTTRYAAEKQLCLDTINAYRADAGLDPVAWSKSLEAFADQGARYDSERNAAHGHFSAFSKGAVPSDAENAVPGWPLKNYKTVAAVVAEGAKMMWAEGPGGGHYENIRGSHAQVGCGIYVTSAGNVWVIHDFK